MEKHYLQDCLHFLRRVVVHGAEQERLLTTVDALEQELLGQNTRHSTMTSDRVA